MFTMAAVSLPTCAPGTFYDKALEMCEDCGNTCGREVVVDQCKQFCVTVVSSTVPALFTTPPTSSPTVIEVACGVSGVLLIATIVAVILCMWRKKKGCFRQSPDDSIPAVPVHKMDPQKLIEDQPDVDNRDTGYTSDKGLTGEAGSASQMRTLQDEREKPLLDYEQRDNVC